MTNSKPPSRTDGGREHARAICPECGFLNVTVFTAPKKPPKMRCTDCGWDSLEVK